jgi:UDP-N-acetylmuramate dehydrogenase
MRIEKNYNLLHHNTFGMDVECNCFVEYDSVEELQEWIKLHARGSAQPFLHIGGGSNLLFTENFRGTVLHSRITSIEVVADDAEGSTLRVGAGVVWDDFVDYAVAHNLYGAENLSLIPGEVGAAAVQNIGAYGSEVKDLIVSVVCVRLDTGDVEEIPVEACCYGYRRSRFKMEWKGVYAVAYVMLRLSHTFSPRITYGNIRQVLATDCPSAREVREAIISIRRQKLPDPLVEGNAGSFFMNPVVPVECLREIQGRYPEVPFYEVDAAHVKIPAGWLIEKCGWKGRSLGNAGVHDKQALVLVNRGGAAPQEIVDLCNRIRWDVEDMFGIQIHTEVNII